MVMGYPGFEDHGRHEKAEVDGPEFSGLDENIREELEVKSKFGIPWKSIIGFLTVFAGQLTARAFVEGIPVIPTNTSGIIALIGGSFVAAVGIYLKANLYTVDQAKKNLSQAQLKSN